MEKPAGRGKKKARKKKEKKTVLHEKQIGVSGRGERGECTAEQYEQVNR